MRKKNAALETQLKYNRERTELTVITSLPTSLYPLNLPDIALRVTANLNDWRNLEAFYANDPERFYHELYAQFIQPAIIELNVTKPRGSHTWQQNSIITMIRRDAGWLYAFFSYWCKKPLDEWPEYLKKLIELAEQQGYKGYIRVKNGRYGKKELTQYCCEKKYGRITKRLHLFPFEDPTHFYQHYIMKSKIVEEVKKKFITDKSPKDIARLAYHSPLFDVFCKLRLIPKPVVRPKLIK